MKNDFLEGVRSTRGSDKEDDRPVRHVVGRNFVGKSDYAKMTRAVLFLSAICFSIDKDRTSHDTNRHHIVTGSSHRKSHQRSAVPFRICISPESFSIHETREGGAWSSELAEQLCGL